MSEQFEILGESRGVQHLDDNEMSELDILLSKHQKELDTLRSMGIDFLISDEKRGRRVAYLEIVIDYLSKLKVKQPILDKKHLEKIARLKQSYIEYKKTGIMLNYISVLEDLEEE